MAAIYGDDGNNLLYDTAINDSIFGLGGNDIIVSRRGVDTVDGGTGENHLVIDYSWSTLPVTTFSSQSGIGESSGGARIGGTPVLTFSNIHMVTIRGGAGNDTIRGVDSYQNRIYGNDALDGGPGADIMAGGKGEDVYFVDDYGDVVEETTPLSHLSGLDQDEVRTALPYYEAPQYVEILTAQSNAGQTLVGGRFLYGAGGDDVLAYATARMFGGHGDDIYLNVTSDVEAIEHPDEGFDIVYLAEGNTIELLANSYVEVLSTVDYNRETAVDMTGNNLANLIYGARGNDHLDGGEGDDYLSGFGGDDTYYVDGPFDRIEEVSGGGADSVVAYSTYVLGQGVDVENLRAFSPRFSTTALTLEGNELNNSIAGNAGDNIINGRGGADIMNGHAGDDIFYVNDMDDAILEASYEGFDIIYTSVDFTLPADVHVELLSVSNHNSTSPIALVANGDNNWVYGNDGDNILDGGGGSDYMLGFGGSDSFAFTTSLSLGNVDQLGDFEADLDEIHLSQDIFGDLAGGALPSSAFRIGTAAEDQDDRIIFNPETGALLFDEDGVGDAAAIQFASIDPNVAITHSDFVVG